VFAKKIMSQTILGNTLALNYELYIEGQCKDVTNGPYSFQGSLSMATVIYEAVDRVDTPVTMCARSTRWDEGEPAIGMPWDDRPVPVESTLFEELFKAVADELAARHIPGYIEYIRKDYPELYREMREAEDHLNSAWTAARNGEAPVSEFVYALEQWQSVHQQAMQIRAQEIEKNEE
jgi:hypothetical protein